MAIVWKFPLFVTDEQEIEVPAVCEPMAVQFQGEGLCLWALVNETAPRIKRTVRIVGTGRPGAPSSLHGYVGTVQTAFGALVWHVFLEPTS